MKLFLKLFLIIIFVTYSYLIFLYAINGYPGFIQDSTCFLPTAYFINHYHQLINPLYDAGLDPVQHRFLFYPPLFPYVVAFFNNLMPEFYNNMHLTLAFIDLISLIVLLASVYVYVKKNHIQINVTLYLFAILWLLALFSFYGIQEGRPEVLCKFFISCFILNNVCQFKRFQHFNNGLLLALNSITSPVSTFYLILITLGLLTYHNQFKFRFVLQAILGGFLVLGVFIFLYPYHIIELIQGLQKHSQNVIVNRYAVDYTGNFIRFYVTYAYAPFLIFNLVVPLLYVLYILTKAKKYVTIPILLLLSLIIAYFSFRDMPMNYNMLVLAPFCFFILFVMLTKLIQLYKPNLLQKTSAIILCLLFLINSTGFLRKTLLFFATQNDKVSYNDFRKEFIQVYNLTKRDKKIAISFSLWPYCLDKYKSITMSNSHDAVQFEMFQQLYSGLSEPAIHPGFKLIRSNFISKHPKIGKIPLGNTYPWFQTAVYKRN